MSLCVTVQLKHGTDGNLPRNVQYLQGLNQSANRNGQVIYKQCMGTFFNQVWNAIFRFKPELQPEAMRKESSSEKHGIRVFP